jgi:hypothetical protein
VKPIDPTLTADAVQAVTGPRQRDYAHPKINFQRIANLWSIILDVDITPEQVALCMIQVKIAREMNRHTRDNLVDLIGYTLTLDACMEDETWRNR